MDGSRLQMNRYKGRFEKKSVLIIGASGGLGESYSEAFLKEGARVLLTSRSEEKNKKLITRLKGDVTTAQVDITNKESLEELVEIVKKWTPKIDIIINATGYDVRKSLETHRFEEIYESLDTNLLGAILVTKIFLPLMKNAPESTIVHMGGFVDGHLAFPYYSVDVASRAGIFSFIESMNRELYQEGSSIHLTYFCPNAADTKSEQPYHGIWKEMGVSISTREEVTEKLLKVIERKQKVYMMGGFLTCFFAKLNTVFPQVAEVVLLNKYSRILKKHLSILSNKEPANHKNKKKIKTIAIYLIVASFIIYGMIIGVPFLKLSLKMKAIVMGGMIAASEIMFWIGSILLGREVLANYKKLLNPMGWICCKKNA